MCAKLVNEFNRLAADFFPDWSQATQWTIRAGWYNPDFEGTEDCRCDPESKTIWIAPGHLSGPLCRLRAVIVHEQCHAATGVPDGPQLFSLLMEKAGVASALGHQELAGALREEAAPYEQTPETTGEDILWRARDIMGENPHISVEVLESGLRREYGLTPEGLAQLCPSLEDVYHKERRR